MNDNRKYVKNHVETMAEHQKHDNDGEEYGVERTVKQPETRLLLLWLLLLFVRLFLGSGLTAPAYGYGSSRPDITVGFGGKYVIVSLLCRGLFHVDASYVKICQLR